MTLPPRAGQAQKNAAEAIDHSSKSLEHRKYYMKTLLLSAAIIAAFATSSKADDITQVLPQVQHQPAPAAPKAPEQPAPPVQHQPEPKHAAPAPAKAPQAPQQAPAAAPSASSTSNSTSAAQAQAGAQAASQSRSAVSDSGNSASRAYGGNSRNALAASGNGANAGSGAGAYAGTTSVNVQGDQAGSGDTYRSLAVALPSAATAVAPSMVAGYTNFAAFRCGPLRRLVGEPVFGRERSLFGVTEVYLGTNWSTADYIEVGPDGRDRVVPYIVIDTPIGKRMFGHERLYMGGMPGVSSANSISLSGFGAGGGGGVGGGNAGGMQRLVKDIDLSLCDLGPLVTAQPTVIIRPNVFVQPIPRKPVRKAPPCVTEDKTIRVCKRT